MFQCFFPVLLHALELIDKFDQSLPGELLPHPRRNVFMSDNRGIGINLISCRMIVVEVCVYKIFEVVSITTIPFSVERAIPLPHVTPSTKRRSTQLTLRFWKLSALIPLYSDWISHRLIRNLNFIVLGEIYPIHMDELTHIAWIVNNYICVNQNLWWKKSKSRKSMSCLRMGFTR